MCQQTEAAAVHPFEKAGLGKAPFKFRGVEVRVCSGPDANGFQVGYTGQPAGTCDYCAAGIKYCCKIESADGKRFIVGCDCVEKLERDDNRLAAEVAKAKKAIDAENRRAAAAKRKEREAGRIEAARAILEEKRPALAAKPHPIASMAADGRTLADYVDWMLKNAGHAGCLTAAKLIEAA